MVFGLDLRSNRAMEPGYYTYVMASRKRGIVYAGATSDLRRRIMEHKARLCRNFTDKFGLKQLVWCARTDDLSSAQILGREIESRSQSWKLALVERFNPGWYDLSDEI